MSLILTPDELNVIYRNDLMSFIERSFLELNPTTRFSSSPYLELMASKLDLCRQGKLRRLIINLPPRSLKSHSISVAFVAWLLGHDPAKQIICASYGQDLSDILAYRMQEKEYGGLSHSARKRLRDIAKSIASEKRIQKEIRPDSEKGTRLLRSWHGEVHEVIVTDSGYIYRGSTFSSLSKIAREITGTQWSGPAFFGTRKTA